MAITEDELKQKLEENDAQRQSVIDEGSTLGDYYTNLVAEQKAAQESPEEKEKRIKADKATAAISGAIEGIGNVYNLVHAANDPYAVPTAGGAPVTEQIDKTITQYAEQRKAAEDKLKAAQEKMNAFKYQQNKDALARLNQQRTDILNEYKMGKEQTRLDELFPYQKRQAEAATKKAEFEADQDRMQESFTNTENAKKAATRASNNQANSQKSANEYRDEQARKLKRENDYWDKHQKEYEDLMNGKIKKGSVTMNFSLNNHPDGLTNISLDLTPSEVLLLVNSDPNLAKDYKKQTRGISNYAAQNKIAEALLRKAMSGDYNYYKGIIDTVAKMAVEQDGTISGGAADDGSYFEQ